MTAEAFLDSSVLLYAVSRDAAEAGKRTRARELLATAGIGFSTQVFSEFYVNATRKLVPRLAHDEAVAILDPLRILPVQPVTLSVIWAALDLSVRARLSLWDAMILVAARALGCRTVWSEDLNAGQVYDGVQVLNPFADGASPKRTRAPRRIRG